MPSDNTCERNGATCYILVRHECRWLEVDGKKGGLDIGKGLSQFETLTLAELRAIQPEIERK